MRLPAEQAAPPRSVIFRSFSRARSRPAHCSRYSDRRSGRSSSCSKAARSRRVPRRRNCSRSLATHSHAAETASDRRTTRSSWSIPLVSRLRRRDHQGTSEDSKGERDCGAVRPTVRAECLDWLRIANRRHLERVLPAFVGPYNPRRPHRSLKLEPPAPTAPSLRLLRARAVGVARHDRFGALIHEYRVAASAPDLRTHRPTGASSHVGQWLGSGSGSCDGVSAGKPASAPKRP